jgi:N-acetylated-alpha-linked acidic dipeptidase
MKAPWLSVVGFLLIAGSGMAAAGQPEPDRAPIPGFTAATSDRQRALEERLAALLDPASTARHFRILTEAPHPSGSERNRELAEYVRARFAEYGLEEVAIRRYDVLLPLPRKVAVSMVEPEARVFALEEDGYPEDKGSYAAEVGPTYLGMSASGDVTAEVIYAHSGNPEDGPWFKHGLYAPRYTYAAMSLPGVREAAEASNWTEARRQLEVLTGRLRAVTEATRRAASEVPGP